MRYKLICCNVFKAELESLISDCDNCLDITYLELGEHARPAILREKLQTIIDESTGYDAILLLYGLCGTATAGLCSTHTPLVLIRNHDCAGILLGSRKRFEELFSPMPSTPFASIGFAASGDYYFTDMEVTTGDSYAKLVEEYGADDAQFIWDAMHPKLDGSYQPIYYIHTLDAPEVLTQCREKAEAEGREFRETQGNLRLIKKLIDGQWSQEEFLTVPIGSQICAEGDWDIIISTKQINLIKEGD